MFNTEQVLLQASLHRPIVLRSAIASGQLGALRGLLNEVSNDRWMRGDSTPHSWQECLLHPQEMQLIALAAPTILRFTESAIRTTAWVNSFSSKQWIGRHRDVDGNAQLICPLKVPSINQGGHLWVHTKRHLIPLQTGDILIFNATDVPHGTMPIIGMDAQRITLNIRLWHNKI